jgi:hypothetical protein
MRLWYGFFCELILICVNSITFFKNVFDFVVCLKSINMFVAFFNLKFLNQ